MKKSIIALPFVIALFCAITCQAKTPEEPCGGFDPAWQSCKQDSDCVVGQNMCGFPTAYNKSSLEASGKYNKCMGPMISCAVPPQDPVVDAIICKEDVCRFLEKQSD